MNLEKDFLFFGLDELEFTIDSIVDDIMFSVEENLDDDNSSYAYLTLEDYNIKFHYSKIYPKGYDRGLKFSTVIDNEIVDCFAILKGRKGKIMTSKNKVVFYSSFFVLEYLKKIDFTLFDFLGLFYHPQLHRLDIALDIPYDIERIQKYLFGQVNFFAQIGRDIKNELFSQTYYINNPRSDRNRKYIFRIYDKILDTVKKQKSFLYPHLVGQADVRRIELELRAEECKRLPYNVYDILGENRYENIKKIYANFFNKHSKKELQAKEIKLKPIDTSPSFNQIKLLFGQLPEDYRRRANGYISNIKANTGYDGVFRTILDQKNHEEKADKDEIIKIFKNFVKFAKKNGINKGILKKIVNNI